MAHIMTIPFQGFRLKFTPGNLFTPLMHSDAIFPETNITKMSNYFKKIYQEKVVDKGEYATILDQYLTGHVYQGEVMVSFNKSKDGFSYPDFELEFKYFFHKKNKGFWAVVPSIAVEVFCDEDNELEKVLQDAIHLEFIRKNRLKSVQNIVEAIWFESVELLRKDVNIKFHTPAELERLKEEKKQEILPLVAKVLETPRQVLFGMKKELKQMGRALKGQFSKNILLVGPSGVGKTTLIWELVRMKSEFRYQGDIWETTASTMIKELTRDTGWQENIAYLIGDLKKRNGMLFVRNLMELFEVGQYEGNSVSMAEYLRPYMDKGQLTLITECTNEELSQIELRSPNYSSYFNVIQIEEPKEDLEKIILKKVNSVAKYANIKITEEAVKETVRLNRRYTPYSGFPGKPIRFLENIILNKKKKWKADDVPQLIGRSEVLKHFCEETGMPQFMIDPEIPMKPSKIKQDFKQDLFGQNEAVDVVIDLLAAVKTGITRQGKPIASLLFVGPTGVGKTELAKILAQFMFGGRDKIIRFDMSEYSEPGSVIRLTGSGYNSDGLLTSAVRRDPFAVVLFDEIEKADSSFYDLLLQVLGEGRLTDSQGKLVNFCSTIIIMTSNIGASSLQNDRVGWNKDIVVSDVKDHFITSVEKHFRPELFNRIDRVIPFAPLLRDTMNHVVRREMALFHKREGIKFRNMSLNISDDVLDYLSEKGYDPKYGARYLQRAIREYLIQPLSKELNQYDYQDRLEVKIELKDDLIQIDVDVDPIQLELMLEELQRNNYADSSSDLRRSIYVLQEGNVYVKLQSELSMLENKKKKQGERFWKNPENGENYTYYLDLKNRMQEITKEIENLEMILSLMVMDLEPYRPEIVEDLRKWEKIYEEIKLDLYIKLNRELNTCHFGIMGYKSELFLDFYLEIIRAKNYDIAKVESIWYNEKDYNALVERTIEVKDENTNELIKEKTKVPCEEYTYHSVPLNKDGKYRAKAKKKGDVLIGFALTVKGPAAFVYLGAEAGRFDWQISKEDRRRCFVQAFHSEPQFTNEVHKFEFFRGKEAKARRIISPPKIKDTLFKIDTDAVKDNYVEIIQKILDKKFKERIENELIGE